jgi:shikimate kinase
LVSAGKKVSCNPVYGSYLQCVDNKFFILGFMAAGKTSLALELSQQFSLPFYDSDAMIEQFTGMSVVEIFNTWGEKYFRRMERDVIHQLMASKGDMIVSLGGGSVCQADIMDWLNRVGYTVWLDTDWSTIVSRLLGCHTGRPLSDDQTAENLKALFDQRVSYYEKAQFRMGSSEEVQNLLREKLALI